MTVKSADYAGKSMFCNVQERFSACRLTSLLWLLCVLMATSTAASAETRVLLIGVSDYPSLPKTMWLQGPRNDVKLMQSTFAKLGIADHRIDILADGIPGSLLPSRKNILDRVGQLIDTSNFGDWVILYFSGHGSQQAQKSRRTGVEADGLDEIYLPYDIGKWEGQRGNVLNAIVDDEIGALLQRFVRKGVSVWAIFDTCHAGDMAKSVDMEARYRSVPSSMLGAPTIRDDTAGIEQKRRVASDSRSSMQAKTPITSAVGLSGEIVTFYSAQPDQPAPEQRIATIPGKPVHGVFTWHLANELERRTSSSYAGVMKAIQSRYRGERRTFPTPGAEGRTDLPLPFTGRGARQKSFLE